MLVPGSTGSGTPTTLAAVPDFINTQLGFPLGWIPFHFIAQQSTQSHGPFYLPAGLVLEAGFCMLGGGYDFARIGELISYIRLNYGIVLQRS